MSLNFSTNFQEKTSFIQDAIVALHLPTATMQSAPLPIADTALKAASLFSAKREDSSSENALCSSIKDKKEETAKGEVEEVLVTDNDEIVSENDDENLFAFIHSQELATFKEKLHSYRPYLGESAQAIAKEMHYIPHGGLNLEEKVNIIFEECLQRKEFLLLDAILLKYPSAKLSSTQSRLKELTLFKEEIRSYKPSWKRTPQEIATELCRIAPKSLTLEEVVNIIFEDCLQRCSFRLFDAILLMHPTSKLSSYDIIRRTIVEDKGEHFLTNQSLQEMITKYGLEADEAKLAACYDLAYQIYHPNIYRLSAPPVSTQAYTLNFLWVNLNPQDRLKDTAQNIFKDGLDFSENDEHLKNPQALRALEEMEKSEHQEKDLEDWQGIKKSFMYRISKWADLHPGAQINLWYDSALVTQKAQQKTFEMMKSISQSRGVNLQLRDIRQLPNIKGEIENSLHPGTPVYYRVDLLKALIADHMMSAPKEAAKYCVVCDIDVEPMPSEQIFDQRTLDYLSSNGYVFNRHAVEADFENNFFIFNKEKEGLKEIHKETMINATAKNISVLRQYPQNGPIHGVGRKDILDAQYIYRRYPEFQSQMNEIQGCIMTPRKIVKCPNSQFNFGGNFLPSDFQSETFRFIGNDQVPYTIGGRNYHSENLEGQIDALKNWKVEPLTLPK